MEMPSLRMERRGHRGMNVIDITKQRQGTFWIALDKAEKGDQIVYHIGEHCGGCHRKDAAKASDQGRVLMFCKRHGANQFAYLAVKR